jgi:hypothetical protein
MLAEEQTSKRRPWSGFLVSKMSPACFQFSFDETAGSRFVGAVRTDSKQVEPTPALALLRQRLLTAGMTHRPVRLVGNRFGSGVPKFCEKKVARKIVSGIFRAPFDRNRCDGLLVESI